MEILLKTPLNEEHKKLNAKMVNFSGWEMPIQYSGIIDEVTQTRENVTIFDVSHMGEFFFTGKNAKEFIQKITCNDVSKLKNGKVQYSALLNEEGNFVDDVTVYKFSDEKFMMCVNASNIEKDFNHILKYQIEDVKIENLSSNFGQIAIQGPNANQLLEKLLNYDLSTIKYYEFAEIGYDNTSIIVARMGYTGEDGFEIFLPKDKTVAFWNLLFSSDEIIPKPAGLGARDILRLEACFPLYGNDISDEINPFEANLQWIVKLNKPDFIGKKALLEKQKSINKKLIRFSVLDKGIPRKDYSIYDENQENEIGFVSSGTSSVVNKKGIGMGFVKTEYANHQILNLKVRDKFIKIQTQKNNFLNK